MDGRVAIASAKLLANVGLAHSPDFPSTIEMLEALTAKSGFGLIAENQVGLGERCVAARAPGFGISEEPRRSAGTAEPNGIATRESKNSLALLKLESDTG